MTDRQTREVNIRVAKAERSRTNNLEIVYGDALYQSHCERLICALGFLCSMCTDLSNVHTVFSGCACTGFTEVDKESRQVTE